jgi:hypothetical protein
LLDGAADVNVGGDVLAGVLPGVDTSTGDVAALTDVPLVDDVASATAGLPVGEVADVSEVLTGTIAQSSTDLGAAADSSTGIVGLPLESTPSLADVPAILSGSPDQLLGEGPTAAASAAAAVDLPDATAGAADPWQPPVDVGGDSPGFFAPPGGTIETPDPGTTLTEVLGTSYMTWKFALFAAALASIGRLSANATGCFNSVQLVTFTNVQLIRCGIVSPIMRLATASAGAVSEVMSGSGTGSARIRTTKQIEAVGHNLRIMADVPRTVVKRALDSDGALMMRLAKLLGLVYAGFLAVWFWGTRLRWR